MDELDRLLRLHRQRVEALGVEVSKNEKDHIRKKFGRQIEKTNDKAEQLMDLVSVLPLEHFYRLDDDGKEDYGLLSDLTENLQRLIFCLDQYEIPRANNPKGLIKDKLVMGLAKLCDNPTCYWDEYDNRYAGTIPDYMSQTLPKFGILAEESQAYAQRYLDIKKQQ